MHARPQVFKKQVDKLQTDHQGTFVLKDNDFRWTSRYAEGERGRSPRFPLRRQHSQGWSLQRQPYNPDAVPNANANPNADTNHSAKP